MEIINFITSCIRDIIYTLSTVPTILGMSWWQFFFSILVVALAMDFVLSIIRGIQLERKIGDRIYSDIVRPSVGFLRVKSRAASDRRDIKRAFREFNRGIDKVSYDELKERMKK